MIHLLAITALLGLSNFVSFANAQRTPVYLTTYTPILTYNIGQTANFDAGTGEAVYFQRDLGANTVDTCEALCDPQATCLGIYIFTNQDQQCYSLHLEQNAAETRTELTQFTAYDDGEILAWRYSNICNPALGDVLAANGACNCGSGRVNLANNSRGCTLPPSGLARAKARSKRSYRRNLLQPW